MKTKTTKKTNIFYSILLIILFSIALVNAQTTISDLGIFTPFINVTGNLTVDTNTLFVDSINNRVGIGTINPINKLHVVTAGNPAKFESTSGNGRIEIDAPSTKNAGVQFFENNVLRWGIFNQGTDDSLKFQNKDFATRLVVQQDGNVGIGTTAPQYKLEVVANVSLNNTLFVTNGGNVGIGTSSPDHKLHSQISSTTTGVYAANFKNTGNGGTADGILIELGVTGNPSGDNEFIQFADGDTVDIGSIEGDGAGAINLFSSSDRRLKENIRNTRYSLLDLMEIKVRDFNFIGTNKVSTGFIAQELNNVYPLAVSIGDFEEEVQDSWKVSLEKLVPLTVKAIQEQQSQIEELKLENDLLKDRLTQIEERLDSMELMCR